MTPRRWLSFCNPELSAVITKWLGHDDWVLDADKLQGLNQVPHRPWGVAKGWEGGWVGGWAVMRKVHGEVTGNIRLNYEERGWKKGEGEGGGKRGEKVEEGQETNLWAAPHPYVNTDVGTTCVRQGMSEPGFARISPPRL